ncbi:YdbH domain-containing protein [Azospirillum doebereinerae]|uniref:intermembrane phospholipid transport protein YdbH family protein n=1 Tax=Azospirillum doebereinerae TaxID=92933 RepID=UPI001EE6233F|nr:YdbH domain-containing protein [Azospirillum doebereinerae]MCG5242101.1 YdbH domain-containing protein [Azospirillum doebereinerae]
MALRKRRRRVVAVAALLLGAWTVMAGLFAAAGLGAAATMALRRAGFDEAVATVDSLGLAEGWRGLRIGLAVDFNGLAGAGAVLGVLLDGRARLSGDLVVGLAGWAVTVTPLGCLNAKVEGLALHGEAVLLPEGATLCAPKDSPVLRWSGDGTVVVAEILVPRLDLPAHALRVEGLTTLLTQTPLSQAVESHAATLRRTVTPAEIAPLAVTAKAEQRTGEPWRFTGTAIAAQGLLTAALTGTHDPNTGEGYADLATKPMKLTAKGPGLKTVSPLLAGLAGPSTGTLTAKAKVAWGPSGLRSSGQVRIQDGAGKFGPVAVGGVNGVVALSSLSPPVVPDGQTLSVALLDVGVPLTDGTIRFGYGRDRKLDVDEAVWRWAGGSVRADPFELSPTAPKGLVTLHADRVDLAQILTLVAVEGMDATGTLSGTLPVRLSGDRVVLDGGVLEAAGNGTLRYDPAHPPPALQGEDGSPGALLLGALTDFRYDTLRLTIDGEAGGELSAGLSVRGANPSFYDGYPVSLNLKLSGALDRILRQSLDAVRIPDTVRERMTGFDQKDP